MRIGHRTMNLGLPMMDAIAAAAELGYDGVALGAKEGWIDPHDFGEGRAREVRQACAARGLTISALTGRLGSLIDEGADERLQRALLVVEAASRLRTPFVTSHIGVIPEDLDREDAQLMLERVGTLCERAAKLGITIGVETGPESPATLRAFIERLGSERLRVNYDPANLLMKGFDHMEGVEVLAPYIVHTHAKDAVRDDPDGNLQRPLGEGDVDVAAWIGELKRVGFDGWVCVERESGDDQLDDARRALGLLREII